MSSKLLGAEGGASVVCWPSNSEGKSHFQEGTNCPPKSLIKCQWSLINDCVSFFYICYFSKRRTIILAMKPRALFLVVLGMDTSYLSNGNE